jgi:hypothetical protein
MLFIESGSNFIFADEQLLEINTRNTHKFEIV